MENKKIKILAIDDNRDNLISIKAILSEALPQSVVYMEESGQGGIESARNNNPDVILLDIVMPGMDGYEVCKTLKTDEQLSETPVIFLTVLKRNNQSRILALEAGGEAFLAKPIDATELKAQILAMVKIKEAATYKRNEKLQLEELVQKRTEELKNANIAALNLLEDLKTENKIRKQSEAALEMSKELLSETESIGKVGGWSLNIDTKEQKWTDEVYRIHEVEISPEPGFDAGINYYTKESGPIIGKALQRAIEHGENYDLELDIITAKGNTRTVHTIGKADLKNRRIYGFFQDITERKQAEKLVQKKNEEIASQNEVLNQANKELIEAKEKAESNEIELIKAQKIAHIGSWYLNVETNEVIWTEELYKMYGFDPRQPVPPYTEHMKLFTPESWQILSKSLAKTRETGIPYELELKTIRKDNSNGWMWVRGEAVLDAGNKIIGLWGAAQDITERKQAEDELRKLSQAVAQSPASVVITNPQGLIEYVNHKFTEVTGYTAEEAIGQKPSILKSGEQSAGFYKELWETISLGKEWTGELHNKKKNGELYWEFARISPILNENREIINYLAVKEDVTELKQAENNFRHSIDQSPLGIRIVNQKGKTVYANQAFLNICDFISLAEYVHTPAKERYTNESYKEHLERKKIRKQGADVTDYEITIRRRNGEIRHVEICRKEVFWNKEKHFQVVNQDITEFKALYNDLLLAKEKAEESDRLKSAFLANMSHEIRTPMNGILGFAELLKEPGLTGEKQQEYIKIIDKSGARMLNIINDIVDISKIEAGLMKLEFSESNVNELIEYIYTFFKPEVEAKGITLSFKSPLPAKQAIIKTDHEKLYAILTNLVKNAIKFTREGALEFGYNLKRDNEADELEYYVKDTGIGIPTDRQKAIFERFIQADIADKMAYQGAGLGLAISKAYVEMLGGKIGVESEEGKGSVFYFTLPYNNEPVAETIDRQLATSEKNNDFRKLKILIAEDDEVSEMLLDATVQMFGKEFLNARTGVEAVEICRDNLDIDLILMDIRMPGLDGYEATKQIREFNKEVIIIAQTAYGLSGDREMAIESGCNDYIAKPINKTELQEMIQKYFGN